MDFRNEVKVGDYGFVIEPQAQNVYIFKFVKIDLEKQYYR